MVHSIGDRLNQRYSILGILGEGGTQTLMEGKKQEAIENYQKAADLYQQQNKPKYAENARNKIKELSTSVLHSAG